VFELSCNVLIAEINHGIYTVVFILHGTLAMT